LTFPCVVAVRFAQLRTWPSTYEEAAAWVLETVDPEEDVVYLSLPMTLPVRSDAASLEAEEAGFPERGLGWYSYQRKVGESPSAPAYRTRWLPLHDPDLRRRARKEFVHSLGGGYCINEVFTGRSVDPQVEDVRIGLQQEGKLLVRFAPDLSPIASLPLDYQEVADALVPNRAPRLLRARALGPYLEVFRLPEPRANPAESR
jgi:hypothetical protein